MNVADGEICYWVLGALNGCGIVLGNSSLTYSKSIKLGVGSTFDAKQKYIKVLEMVFDDHLVDS